MAYDGLVRDNARRGADMLAVPTNDATFNPAEAAQRLAVSRLRAIGNGRPEGIAVDVDSAIADTGTLARIITGTGYHASVEYL